MVLFMDCVLYVLWCVFVYGQCRLCVLGWFFLWTVCCRFCCVVYFTDSVLYVFWRGLFMDILLYVLLRVFLWTVCYICCGVVFVLTVCCVRCAVVLFMDNVL